VLILLSLAFRLAAGSARGSFALAHAQQHRLLSAHPAAGAVRPCVQCVRGKEPDIPTVSEAVPDRSLY